MDTGEWTFIIIISIWICVSVFGNFLTIAVVLRTRKLWNVTNVLICNLAISDILLAAIVIPQQVHDISHTEDFFEPEILCRLVNCLPVWCISSSIYSLVAMSVERYRAIVLQVNTPFTPKLCLQIIFGIWVVASIIMTPTVFEFSVHKILEDNATHRVCQPGQMPYEYSLLNGLFVLIFSYLGPQLLLYINYGRLLMFLWKKSKTGNAGDNNGSESSGSSLNTSVVSRSKAKILKMLLIIAALFSLSWIPYFTLLMIAKITGTDSSDAGDFSYLLQITLAIFSTSYNIILYVSYNPTFKKGVLSLFGFYKANSVGPTTEETM